MRSRAFVLPGCPEPVRGPATAMPGCLPLRYREIPVTLVTRFTALHSVPGLAAEQIGDL